MNHNQLLQLARDLAPITRTGWSIECCQCHQPVHFGHIYFANRSDLSNESPWCRGCALALLLAVHMITWDMLIQIPAYGEVPSWMSSAAAEDWNPPRSTAIRGTGRSQVDVNS